MRSTVASRCKEECRNYNILVVFTQYSTYIVGLTGLHLRSTTVPYSNSHFSELPDETDLYRSGGRSPPNVINGDNVEKVDGVSFEATDGVMIGFDVGDFLVFQIRRGFCFVTDDKRI